MSESINYNFAQCAVQHLMKSHMKTALKCRTLGSMYCNAHAAVCVLSVIS